MLSVLKRSTGGHLARRFSCLLSQSCRVNTSATCRAGGRRLTAPAGGSSCLGLHNACLPRSPLHSCHLSTSLANYNPDMKYEASLQGLDKSTAAGNSEEAKMSYEEKLFLVQTEVELDRESGLDVPDNLTDKHWQELAQLNSQMARRKYLRFLLITDFRKKALKKKKELKRQVQENHRLEIARELEAKPDHISYGLWRNSIFIKAESQNMANVNNHRVFNACMYGQHIILDNGFGDHMNSQEEKSLVHQLNETIKINRTHRDPFYMHICNFDSESRCANLMTGSMRTLLNGMYPIDVHKEHYLDLFDKDKLVYLTPHCEEDLKQYDHNALYIIGNIVDRGTQKPLTLAKAKREGIKMAKFPLEKYLDWGCGSKLLTIDQVVGIMLELKHTGSWVKAFKKHIPVRKLKKAVDEDHLRKKWLRSKQAVKGSEL